MNAFGAMLFMMVICGLIGFLAGVWISDPASTEVYEEMKEAGFSDSILRQCSFEQSTPISQGQKSNKASSYFIFVSGNKHVL